jgi:putative membrane protein
MVVTPLARRRGRVRRALVPAVVGGLAAASTLSAAQRWDPRRAALAAAAVLSSTALVEAAGTRSGVPFGRYSYTGALRPHVGGVPVVVPAAWLAMALPSREAAHAALGATSTPLRRVLLGAAALTAWDLFLDPQMVAAGHWTWADPNPHLPGVPTVPLTNYAGWLFVATAISLVLQGIPRPSDDRWMLGLYLWTYVSSVVGLLVFLDLAGAAAWGALGMGLVAIPLAVRLCW